VIGTSQANYSLLEGGKVALSAKHARKMGDVFGVNFEWLLEGGDKPVAKNHIFLQILPSPGLSQLSPIYQSRKRNELLNAARSIFTTFFKENLEDRSYFISQEPTAGTIIAAKLSHESIVILLLRDQKLAEEIIKALYDLGLERMDKSIDVGSIMKVSRFRPHIITMILGNFGFPEPLVEKISRELDRSQTRFERSKLDENTPERERALERIVKMMIDHNIKLCEIRKVLFQEDREDLLVEKLSNLEEYKE